MFSVQSMTIATAIQGAWMAVPDDMRSHVPSGAVYGLTIALLVAGIVGRLITQDSVSKEQ